MPSKKKIISDYINFNFYTMEHLTGKEILLVAFALVSLFGAPLLFFDFLSGCFTGKDRRFWWFKEPGVTIMKTWTIIEVVLPILIAIHWIIVAIYFPNIYK
jgi:hypothetical protein